MNLNVRYICSVVSPVIMVSLFVMSFVMGCHRRVDPLLSDVDTKMEEYPDSAMLLLDSYTLSDNTSDYDRAYYGMLLTHARYKNFIDETNDSLISLSTDYFLEHGYKALASRSLFLQGMIQMNANRLGEAAVSFSKGLDIAKESKQYIWEGQCARGLCMIYGNLFDGSAQVNYANKSYEAFLNTQDTAWIDYSKLTLAVAYNNNGKYEDCLSMINQIFENDNSEKDSLMLSELYRLKGLSLFAVGKYEESLKFYNQAYKINPDVLSDGDIRNVQVAVMQLPKVGISNNTYSFIDNVITNDCNTNVHNIYANEGKYKEAYERLEAYKNRQDSVISIILCNNVSESVNQYNTMKSILLKKDVRNERMTYWIFILVIIVIGIAIVWRIREKMLMLDRERLKTEADMESLRADLLLQLESAKMELGTDNKESDQNKTNDFEKIIRQRYAEANRLCDDYYQIDETRKNKGVYLHSEINSIIAGFKNKESLEKIAEYVNEKSGGLYSSFKKDFFHLSADSHRLFLYLILGLSARTLSVIIGQSINAVYIKKSRLKAKVEQSDVTLKNEYLKFF